MSTNIRDKGLDAFRGVGIILVVWMHMYATISAATSSVPSDLFVFSKVALEILIVLSGALYFRKCCTPGGTAKTLALAPVKTYLIPFYALNILFAGVMAISSLFSGIQLRDAGFALWSLLNFHIDTIPSGVLWFLLAIFESCLAVYFLIVVCKINKFIVLALSLALLIASNVFPLTDFIGIRQFCRAFFYFMIGCVMTDFIRKHDFSITQCAVILAISCLSYVCFVTFSNSMGSFKSILVIPIVLMNILSVLVIIRGLQKLPLAAPLISLMAFFGVNSMAIFVFHMPASKFLLMIMPAVSIPASVYTIFVCLIIIPGTIVLGKIIERSKVFSMLLLGKYPKPKTIA